MNQTEMKQAVARQALDYLVDDSVIGVGTGSTVDFFIAELGKVKQRIKGAVASSERSAEQLVAHGIALFDLADLEQIAVYIDGADEINASGAMIKGGGAALTREKIVAAAARQFVCIADQSKQVSSLGKFPLPVEVIPMARAVVARQLTMLGATPRLRLKDGQPLVTDNGGMIIDALGLQISDPLQLESRINNIPGVVTVGLFAQRGADICLLGTETDVKVLAFSRCVAGAVA